MVSIPINVVWRTAARLHCDRDLIRGQSTGAAYGDSACGVIQAQLPPFAPICRPMGGGPAGRELRPDPHLWMLTSTRHGAQAREEGPCSYVFLRSLRAGLVSRLLPYRR